MLGSVLALGVLSGSLGAAAWVLMGGSVWAAVLVYGLTGSLGVVLVGLALLAGLPRERPALAGHGPSAERRLLRDAQRRKGSRAIPSGRRHPEALRAGAGSR